MSPKKIFKWSSHQPVIKTLLALLEPQLIVELGVGNFSTPLMLASGAARVLHIENDQPWLDHVRQQFASDDRSEFIYHDLGPGINKATPWASLSEDWQQQQRGFYGDLAHSIQRMDLAPGLLFVDHYTCIRLLSINCLANLFDAVIYHDAEHPGVYGYDSIDPDLAPSFDHYQLETVSSWTGFMIRKGRCSVEDLESLMMSECASFGQPFGRSVDSFRMRSL